MWSRLSHTTTRVTARTQVPCNPYHGSKNIHYMPSVIPTLINLLEIAGQSMRDAVVSLPPDLGRITKRDNSPVTAVDHLAHDIITEGLKPVLPDDLVVLSEEDVSAGGISRPEIPQLYQDAIARFAPHRDTSTVHIESCLESWNCDFDPAEAYICVDPLDGTWELIAKRFEAVTVMAGIIVKGKPVFGVIHQPWTGRTVYGCPQSGQVFVRVNGECDGPLDSDNDDTVAVNEVKWITTRNHASPKMEGIFDTAVSHGHAGAIIRSGGAGGKFLRLLDPSEANAYVLPYSATRIWDTCAGEALLRAAGGDISTTDGSALRYPMSGAAVMTSPLKNPGGLVATPPGIDHAALIEQLQQTYREVEPLDLEK